MKRFDSLIDPEVNKNYIKQYILIHKTGNEYEFDKSDKSQYDYVGEISEDNANDYVTSFYNNTEYSLDSEMHQNINDLEIQLNDIENEVEIIESTEITEFNESINTNNFAILLENSKTHGYYSDTLIRNIENNLLDETIVAVLNEKKNEILNND